MPSKNPLRPAVVNTREAAIYLNIAQSTLEKKRSLSDDGPPFYDLDGAIRYRLVDLDRWIADRQYRSTGDRDRRRPRKPRRKPKS